MYIKQNKQMYEMHKLTIDISRTIPDWKNNSIHDAPASVIEIEA